MLSAVSDAAVRRILLDADPYAGHDPSWSRRAEWPVRWIVPAEEPKPPFVAGYRLVFEADGAKTIRLHVSGDERYELYLDGVLIGRGPDRGDVDHWTFDTFEADLSSGAHILAARVWTLGEEAPFGGHTRTHGFLLACDGLALNTGHADWQVALLPGHHRLPAGVAWGCGPKLLLDGREFPWGWEKGSDKLTWAKAANSENGTARRGVNDKPPGHLLVPAAIPAQIDQPFHGGKVRYVANHPGGPTNGIVIRQADSLRAEESDWQAFVNGKPLTIPPQAKKRVIVDLQQYVCAYPELTLLGGRGGSVRIHWQEALFEENSRKGNRDEIEGKRFRSIWRDEDGVGDRFIAGGGEERHRTLWWEAGRYLELLVETADEPLTLVSLQLFETRYPLEDQSEFTASDDRLGGVKRIAHRTLQMCAHETYMDCPFYEQLQYAGDTRLQCLVTYVTSDDDRLPRQALRAFDRSRLPDLGLTQSRYPSRILQIIPPFSLWWVAMVHDFARWRGDKAFVRSLMPGVRGVLDAYRANVDADGVFHALDGWNFSDWVPAWQDGAAPGSHWGVSGLLNAQLIHVLDLANELETWLDEPELASRHHKLADRMRHAYDAKFWDAARGLYADDPEHAHWSEHSQCLALLAGAKNGEAAVRKMIDADSLERTTVYFDHYLFEALGRVGRTDVILKRMALWFDLLNNGLRTVVEMPEPTRSDCHAWGAHPVYHYFTNLLGVQPMGLGMTQVRIRPNLGGLAWAEGTLRTPHGPIHVRADENGVRSVVPKGIEKH